MPASGGTFIGLTSESDAGNLAGSCSNTDDADEAVFSWTPTASGLAIIQTCDGSDTDFDTVLYVRSGSCFGGDEVACNNDGNGCQTSAKGKPRGSRIKLDVLEGETYFVVVDGMNGVGGQFTLTISAPTDTDAQDGTTTATLDAMTGARLDPDPAAAGEQPLDAATDTESPPPAYRCHHTTVADTTAETPSATEPLHLRRPVRRARRRRAKGARALCAPVATADGDLAAGATLERWDLVVDEYSLRAPRAIVSAPCSATSIVELVRPDAGLQAPVTVAPPLRRREPDIADAAGRRRTCYKVRAAVMPPVDNGTCSRSVATSEVATPCDRAGRLCVSATKPTPRSAGRRFALLRGPSRLRRRRAAVETGGHPPVERSRAASRPWRARARRSVERGLSAGGDPRQTTCRSRQRRPRPGCSGVTPVVPHQVGEMRARCQRRSVAW